MGRLPTLQLVERYGWHAALAEPAPPTFRWLRANFGAGGSGLARGVRMAQMGLRSEPRNASEPSQVWVLEADVPELGSEPLPAVARQRLQWATSVDYKVRPRLIARWRARASASDDHSPPIPPLWAPHSHDPTLTLSMTPLNASFEL